MYVEAISDEKNRSLIEYIQRPSYVDFFQIHMWITNGMSQCHKKTNGNSLSAKQTTKHNLLPKKTPAPWSPPHAGLQRIDIAVHRAIEHHLHYTAMQFFYVQLTLSYFISYYSSESGSARTLTEGEFFKRIVALFSCSLHRNDAH